MNKLDELKNAFSSTKKTGVEGEKLVNKTVGILRDIDELLANFTQLQTNPELMSKIADSAGGSQMEYALAIAGILAETKFKVEALG